MSLSPLVVFWTQVPIVTSSKTSLSLKAQVPYHLPQHRPQFMVFPGQSLQQSNDLLGIRLLSSNPSTKVNILALGWMTQFPTVVTTFSSLDYTFRISFGATTVSVPMASDSLYYITKDQVKQLLTHVNIITLNNRVTSFTKEQLARADEVRRLHDALLHPSDNVLIKALKYGMLIGTRLTTQDVYFVFGACPCCLADKTISSSYKESLSPTALMPGGIVHID